MAFNQLGEISVCLPVKAIPSKRVLRQVLYHQDERVSLFLKLQNRNNLKTQNTRRPSAAEQK